MGKKKEKNVYVDDGRTVADMSALGGGRLPRRPRGVPGASWKERWQTYFAAVKMMVVPMLTVITALAAVYMLLWLLLFLAS